MKLICLGAKNPEIVRTLHAVISANLKIKFLGFIDKDKKRWGTTFHGHKVIGGMDKVREFAKKGVYFCNFVNRDTKTRFESTVDLVKRGAKLTNVIHPDVNLDMVTIGTGNYIQDHVILQSGVCIGNNVSIQAGTVIGHESIIGDSVSISPACSLSSFVKIGDGAYLGIGVTIIPRVKIGKWSYIGAGTVVIHDVPAYSVVVGTPARIIKKVEKIYSNGKIF